MIQFFWFVMLCSKVIDSRRFEGDVGKKSPLINVNYSEDLNPHFTVDTLNHVLRIYRLILSLEAPNAKRLKPSTSTPLERYSRIWRNAFKCAWMWKETSFSIDYEQVLFCVVPGMCI